MILLVFGLLFNSFNNYILIQGRSKTQNHYKNVSHLLYDGIEMTQASINSGEEQNLSDEPNLEYGQDTLDKSSCTHEKSTKRSVGTRRTRKPRNTFSTTLHPRLDIIPKLMMFEADRVLWPFFYESEVVLPYDLIQPTAWPLPERKGHRWWTGNFGGRELVDNNGKCLQLNYEALVLFLKLRHRGIQLALTVTVNNSSNIIGIKHLVRLFEYEDIFNYSEIDEGSALEHVRLIKEQSGLEFRDMVYFGINKTVLDDLHKELKVITVHINPAKGLGEEDVQEGARLYAIRPHVPRASEIPLTVGKIVSDEEAANIYEDEVMKMFVQKSEESASRNMTYDISESDEK
ncbi:uncharacterized protein LOC124363010 [Homalodisca vitripennis]|uniref:uncharacterized protein LOC124363010 n=1 Tax=Homalodisca vitripennis TaxID=197043 RepID=UPI001EEBA58C|nr:uncharacterized protein LOC124363010 [Homalodisca vitripennis]KAG8313636.1 Magnesium-dependent phosphatase 1 [Homalodisca vitripennis]KAG8313638.1 Magnesium-dependent phosphatase 1 [Homalodisca vitripennis]KAG8334056.1 Magnesium-dependent phosphatase 1 [Homalodisca vitripennis]